MLDSKKSSLHERNKKYAKWTLPYLYPEDDQEDSELDSGINNTGARLINHLSNKIIETLFPSYRSFMKLELDDEVQEQLKDADVPTEQVDVALVKGEKKSIRQLNKMAHRTAATLAAKYLLITGNGLMYYPEDNKAMVYSTKDYCIVRDLSGVPIEIITRDIKSFETFNKDVQDKLRLSNKDKEYKLDTDVTLYTHIVLEDNKYKIEQHADKTPLEMNSNTYAKKDLPWVPLTWNLIRGEDYGRSMVEDYRGTFGAVETLSQALLEGIISAAAIQYLVNPASVVDVVALNKAKNGAYHSGRDGDIVAIKSDKHLDFQQVRQVLDDYQRQLAQAFLMNSELTRDAERVTAAEIRKDAQELEMSFGGIYSRFTEDWQEPVARLLLSRQNITIADDTIYPVIVTGLDTLSRMGDLDNYRMFLEDLSMINTLDEQTQQSLKRNELISWLGNNRGIDYSKFIKTADELQAEIDAEMQRQQQMQTAETQNQMAQDASKAIVNQE